MRKRAAIYVWVRSHYDSPTINEQLALCRIYLRENNYAVQSETCDERDRRHRKQLLHAVGTRELTLCVSSLDRLGNTVNGLLVTIEKLYDSGCELISIKDKIDTTKSVGFAHLLALRGLVKYRRTETQQDALKGKKPTKYPGRPYGYSYDRPADLLTPIQAEQDIISGIVAMFERDRLTPAQITKEMNKTTPPPMNACRWHIKQIQRILERESDEY